MEITSKVKVLKYFQDYVSRGKSEIGTIRETFFANQMGATNVAVWLSILEEARKNIFGEYE